MKNVKKGRALRLIFVVSLLVLMVLVAGCAPSNKSSGTPKDGIVDTNNQVEGVIEADVIKVINENFIARLSPTSLTIFHVDEGKTRIAARKAFSNFTPSEMLVYGDKLVVIGEATYSEYTRRNPQRTQLYIVDLSGLENEEAEISVLRFTDLPGTYAQGRLLNGKLYILTKGGYLTAYEDKIGGGEMSEIAIGDQKAEPDADAEDSGDPNVTKQEQSIADSAYSAALFMLDLENVMAAYKAKRYTAYVHDMYLCEYGAFLISHAWVMRYGSRGGGCTEFFSYNRYSYKTFICRVDLSTLEIAAQTKTLKSNWDGYTVADRYSLHATENTLFAVVREADRSYGVNAYDLATLDKIGSVGGVAKGESLHGVSFRGDYCYFVTYRNVDPLFKVDISDPTDLKLVGELKIPGFSEHLQPFNGYLIGLGYTDSGRIKVSLFNDDEQLSEVNNIVIDNFWYAPAADNPKAILVDPENNVFGFGVRWSRYDGGVSGGNFGYCVFGIEDGRLTLRKQYTNENYGVYYVDRAVRIGGYIYAVSANGENIYAFYADTLEAVKIEPEEEKGPEAETDPEPPDTEPEPDIDG